MVTRNSVEVSSTPISADELNSVRTIVLVKISSTSSASMTFSRTMTALSIACSQPRHALSMKGRARLRRRKREFCRVRVQRGCVHLADLFLLRR